MNKRKTIAVFIADLQTEYNQQIMEGITDQARILDYNIDVYTCFSNREADEIMQVGEENIINLFDPQTADGILIQKASFNKPSIRNRLDRLCRESGLPYADLDDYELGDGLKGDRVLFCELVSHLIEVHNARKIYCLTGMAGFHQSESRLEGYRDAMNFHGLPHDKNDEFYGDFWTEAAKALGERIACGDLDRPDAVACANGAMALSLTNTLISCGLRVPDDIAVVGYDSFFGNVLNTPSITTLSGMHFNRGVLGVTGLHERITGERCDTPHLRDEIIEPGESCGCHHQRHGLFEWYRKELSELIFYQELYQASGMLHSISRPDNLVHFSEELHRYNYLVRGMEKMHICICDDWDGINNTEADTYRVTGYSDQLLVYRHGCNTERMSYCMIDRDELHNHILENDEASVHFFVPLHYEDRCFGFVALQVQKDYFSFDRQFWTWTKQVSAALETIRIRNYIRKFSERTRLNALRDPMTGLYNRRGFEEISAEVFEQAIINKEKFLLLAVDIYQFREINQKMGYAFGDSVLMTLADAVNSSCRGNEICCRCGDDNFYILGSFDYPADAGKVHMENIRRYFAKHLEDTGGNLHIELDMGCTCEKVGEDDSLHGLIAKVNRIIEQNRLEDNKRITYLNSLLELRKQIYKDPQKRWTVDLMSQTMLLSRAYFQRLYKKNFGVSAMADVITARIALAKQLLTSERRSIAEIAAACGYDSEIYFMQQFKKETGMTPTQFRKQKLSPLGNETI